MKILLLILAAVFVLTCLAALIGVILDACDKVKAKKARAAVERSRAFKAESGSTWLAADGREIFTPQELLVGRVYAVTACGEFSRAWGKDKHGNLKWWKAVDPLYQTDDHGNFTAAHAGMRLDGKPAPRTPYHMRHHDRDTHVYRFHVDGTGAKLSMALEPYTSDEFFGGVFVKVELLPEGTPSPAAQPLEEAARAAAEAHQADIRRRVASLLLVAQPLRNWADDDFRRDVARQEREQLLHDRAAIAGGHIALLAKEPEAMDVLRREHPHEYACLTGRLPAYLLAERESVKPPTRRRRPTTKDVQNMIARREATAAEDERVVEEAALKGYDKREETLRASGITDQDEIENLLGTRADVIAAARQRLEARKEGGGNGALQKLG